MIKISVNLIKTFKIVDGAVIDFNWQSGKLSDNGAKGDFGKLTASCTVKF